MNVVMNNLSDFFDNRSIQFIIGGGYAIKILAQVSRIECPFPIHNLDIFYMANTPITSQFIHTYRRVQDSTSTSVTYITEEGLRINVTMLRGDYLRCIKIRDINIMHPMKLHSYYMDTIEQTHIHIQKMTLLKNIDTIIPKERSELVYKYYQDNDNDNENILDEPVAQRLLLDN